MGRHAAAASIVAMLALLVMAMPVSARDRDGDGLRDGFEKRYGVTSPSKADTDGDGVVDSAEDDDGDRLSNLAEQRFKTDPGNPDTDGDGVRDGDEDHDGDGRRNAREQDQRPVPRGLRPTLAGSIDDVPSRKVACLSKTNESRIRPCAYGDLRAGTTVVIFGDSHASHWLPALDRAGSNKGWRVVSLVKGSCRSAWHVRPGAPRTPCAGWRRNALRWLNKHEPDVIIISNASPREGKAADWKARLDSTIAALPSRSQVVVLSDTPKPDGMPADCLLRHQDDMSRCVFRRAAKLPTAIVDAEKAAAADAGALHASLFDKVCSYDPCPLVQGDRLIYRGVHHLTATISRQLAPSMRAIVEEALAMAAATDVPEPGVVASAEPGVVASLEPASS